jgi:hypothetical protein
MVGKVRGRQTTADGRHPSRGRSGIQLERELADRTQPARRDGRTNGSTSASPPGRSARCSTTRRVGCGRVRAAWRRRADPSNCSMSQSTSPMISSIAFMRASNVVTAVPSPRRSQPPVLLTMTEGRAPRNRHESTPETRTRRRDTIRVCQYCGDAQAIREPAGQHVGVPYRRVKYTLSEYYESPALTTELPPRTLVLHPFVRMTGTRPKTRNPTTTQE